MLHAFHIRTENVNPIEEQEHTPIVASSSNVHQVQTDELDVDDLG